MDLKAENFVNIETVNDLKLSKVLPTVWKVSLDIRVEQSGMTIANDHTPAVMDELMDCFVRFLSPSDPKHFRQPTHAHLDYFYFQNRICHKMLFYWEQLCVIFSRCFTGKHICH